MNTEALIDLGEHISSEMEQVVLDGMNRHICRCTGYVRYLTAVKDVILSTPGLTVDGPARPGGREGDAPRNAGLASHWPPAR